MFSTDDGTYPPIQLLNVDSSIPSATTFVTTANATLDILHNSSELSIIWNLGVLYNQPDGFKDINDIIQNVYTIGISTNASLTSINIDNYVMDSGSNQTEDALNINLNVVAPELITSLNIEVCCSSHFYWV